MGAPITKPHLAAIDGARIGFSAHTIWKRSDFGMGAGAPAPRTMLGVGDAVEVSIETEFSSGSTTAETRD